MNFRLIAKIGLILVVIGFCMPILSVLGLKGNGFEIAKTLMKFDKTIPGIFTYIVFITAIIGIVIGAALLARYGANIPPIADLIVVIACIASGLIVYFGSLENSVKLQNGAYFILAGWIVAGVGEVLPLVKR